MFAWVVPPSRLVCTRRRLWDARFEALDSNIETLTNEEETDGRHNKRR